jgi:hypothetical protein
LSFFPAPAALGEFLDASLFADAWLQAVVGLLLGETWSMPESQCSVSYQVK